MGFFSFIAKNVLRRPVRSLLTGMGIAVAIAAVVSLLGVSDGFEQTQLSLLTARDVDLVVERAGLGQQTTARLDESIVGQLQGDPKIGQRILKLTPMLMDKVKLQSSPIPIVLRGYPPGSFALDNLHIQPGGKSLGAADKDGVLLGSILARNLGKKVGESVEIELKKFRVAGIYNGSSPLRGQRRHRLARTPTNADGPGRQSLGIRCDPQARRGGRSRGDG